MGVMLLIAAALTNPWVIARYVTLSGEVSRRGLIYTIQLVLLLLGIGLLLASRRVSFRSPTTRREVLGKVLLAVLAVGLSIAVAEIGLRLILGPELLLRGQVLWEYRYQQRAAQVDRHAQAYSFDRHDRDLGWLPKPDYDHDGVRTNSLGIRAGREYAFHRSPGLLRVVVLGDSFTWGEDARNEETFCANLERQLPNSEVINLGVHGYGIDQQLLYLRKLGLRFAPDLVILALYDEDLDRALLSFREYAKPRFVLDGKQLVLTNTPVPSPEEIGPLDVRLPASYLLRTLCNVWDELAQHTIFGGAPSTRERWRLGRAILETLRGEAETHGARFLLVHVPNRAWGPASVTEQLVAVWAAESGADFLSLREEFDKLDDQERARLYAGHFTPFGHAQVAGAIHDHLIRERRLVVDP
jgi:hypothetical protein